MAECSRGGFSLSNDKRQRHKNGSAAQVLIIIGVLVMLLAAESFLIQRSDQQQAYRTASVLAEQIQNILDTNSRKERALVETLKESYITRAKAVAYITDLFPGVVNDVDELKHIAELNGIDEIHIFDESGTIISGSVPKYYGYSFDSGEQMAYFKPMLQDRGLTMCQDVSPNTAEGKSMMYAICWNRAGNLMIQVGIEPLRLLEELRTNQMDEVVDGLPAYEGIAILVADPSSGVVIGTTEKNLKGRTLTELGLWLQDLTTGQTTLKDTSLDGHRCYCAVRSTSRAFIVVAMERNHVHQSMPTVLLNMLILLLFSLGIIIFIVRRMTLRILSEHHIANTDALTGLMNRRAYAEALKKMRVGENREDLVYISMDLNGLKKVNDTLGHESGDDLLVSSAALMQQCFGLYGAVYRIGGDEFAAIIHADGKALAEAESQFNQKMKEWPMQHGLELSISYGIARAQDFPRFDPEEMARFADEEMYRAKAAYYRTKDRTGETGTVRIG